MTKEQLAMNFWGRFEQAQLAANKLSLKQLCQTINVPYQTIINQKSSARLPSLEFAVKSAQELNSSVEWLFCGDNTPQKNQTNIKELFNSIAHDERKLSICEKVSNLSQSELFAMEVFLRIRK